jgi:Holliday junction resolvasome RuvABC endonuclease subunit
MQETLPYLIPFCIIIGRKEIRKDTFGEKTIAALGVVATACVPKKLPKRTYTTGSVVEVLLGNGAAEKKAQALAQKATLDPAKQKLAQRVRNS